jgi:hypothetical protein
LEQLLPLENLETKRPLATALDDARSRAFRKPSNAVALAGLFFDKLCIRFCV